MDQGQGQSAPVRRGRHLSGSILSVGGSRALSLAVVAGTSVAITRILGADGIGTYAVAQALLLVVATVFELGLPQAVAYYAGRDEWSGRPLAVGVVGASIALALPSAAVALGGFALFGDSIPGMTWPMAIALTVALPAALLWRIGPQAALAQERFETFALLDSAPALIACPTSIAAAALWGVEAAVIALAVATFVAGVAIAIWLLAGPGGAGPDARPPGGPRAVTAYGLPVWGSELLTQVNVRAGLIAVGVYAGATASGIFSIGLSTANVVWMTIAAFAISALPRSARLQAGSERDTLSAADRDAGDARTIRHTVIAAPPAAVGGALLAIVGIPLFYGSALDASIEIALLLLPGSLLLGVGMAAVSILLARGRTGLVLATNLAVVPATIAVLALVVPSGGPTGAAVVSTLSFSAFALVALALLSTACRLPARDLLIPRAADLDDYRVLAARLLPRASHKPA